ncbi:MAG: hypothetical protein R3F43_31465 [bacterium]
MGVVRLAAKAGLKRTVAVKRVLDRCADEVVAALLREGLDRGEPGAPEHPAHPHAGVARQRSRRFLVMKRIEGLPWAQALADATVAPARPASRIRWSGADVFTPGLSGGALRPRPGHRAPGHQARQRDARSLRRGLPGGLGLAASLDPQVPAWMPRAADIKTVVGTPAYMAPELALAAGARIDARRCLPAGRRALRDHHRAAAARARCWRR